MKLQPLLTEYFIENGYLPFIGAGGLSIQHTAATLKESETIIEPPTDSIIFSSVTPTDSERQALIHFISNKLNISVEQATGLVMEKENSPAFFIDTDTFNETVLGSFQNGADGTFLFTQTKDLSSYLPAIHLQSIQHLPEVEALPEVDSDIHNDPAEEYIEPVKKDYWWVWAIIISIVSVALILFHYFLR